MADPETTAANKYPYRVNVVTSLGTIVDSFSGGGGGGGAITVADGADTTQGALTDSVVAAGAAGSISAKLRRLTTDISALNAKFGALGQTTMSGSSPIVIASDQSAVAVKGGVATGAAIPTTPVMVAMHGSGSLVQNIRSAGNLGPTSTGVDFAVAMAPYLYNGSNLDQIRSVINATNSTGTGITAVGLVAQLDDTSPTAITENQFGNVRMNGVRALYHENGPYVLGRATADAQIKASAGFIHSVSIAPLTATPTAGLLTIYDNTAESGTVVYSEWIFATGIGHTVLLDVPCGTGIYVGFDASLANVQVTISYR